MQCQMVIHLLGNIHDCSIVVCDNYMMIKCHMFFWVEGVAEYVFSVHMHSNHAINSR